MRGCAAGTGAGARGRGGANRSNWPAVVGGRGSSGAARAAGPPRGGRRSGTLQSYTFGPTQAAIIRSPALPIELLEPAPRLAAEVVVERQGSRGDAETPPGLFR